MCICVCEQPTLGFSVIVFAGSTKKQSTSEIMADLYPLYKKFEDALVNNTRSLYELKDLFFPPNIPNIREVQQ